MLIWIADVVLDGERPAIYAARTPAELYRSIRAGVLVPDSVTDEEIPHYLFDVWGLEMHVDSYYVEGLKC